MYRAYKIAATRKIKLSPDSEVGFIARSKRNEIGDLSGGRFVRGREANFDKRR
jgi:hypothetical protein